MELKIENCKKSWFWSQTALKNTRKCKDYIFKLERKAIDFSTSRVQN